ncbi:MerR family transcriptional regulator [Guptibacillus algicola]|uniref:MerR family transcriptional regulator n=1 Tax=Guptibacillus algicola TaxID=225844 RepID=UPI001CD5FD56|nr:MerR family transcriptional regulator [Alkalihalobacillus algicola]MCA0985664.1 MerR family transcriptional regulator [Alkalihalobacillus algicola]
MNNQLMISGVADLFKVTKHTLKQWENQFAEFLEIPRDENNSRTYTDRDLEILYLITNMKASNTDDEAISLALEQHLIELEEQKAIDEMEELESDEAVEEDEFEEEELQPDIEPEIKAEEPIVYTTYEDQSEIKESLSKIVSFVESEEVKQLLKMDKTVKRMEKDIVHQIHEIVHEEIATASDAHASMNQLELNAIGKKIDDLTDASVDEREYYQQEVEKERKVAEAHMSEREERLMAIVQNRFRSEESPVKRNEQTESKWGVGKIKHMLGFVR